MPPQGREGRKRRSLPFAFLLSVQLLFHGELPAVEREGDGKRRRGGEASEEVERRGKTEVREFFAFEDGDE